MTPAGLNSEIKAKAQELATEICTTEQCERNNSLVQKKIEHNMRYAAISAIEVILAAYGEFTKVSPAMDRMRATLAEIKANN